MPQFDPATFVPQLFWLAVTFVLLLIAMRRYALPRIADILEARQARITGDLEKAGGLKEEADRVMAEYEQALAETRARAAAMIKQASDEMAAESTKRHQAFAAELAAQTKAAEARIAAAKDETLRGLKAVAADAAQAATAKLIGIEPKADQVRKAVEQAMEGRA
jgi:F-type H+-transporting ATPase subunit b